MVLRGNGSGGLTLVGEFPTGAAPSSVVLANLTGDNLLDVIVGNRTGGTVSSSGVGGGLLGPARRSCRRDRHRERGRG